MEYVTLTAKQWQEVLARNVWFTPEAERYLLELASQSDSEKVKKWIKSNLRNYLTNDVKLDKITRNTKLPDTAPDWLKEKKGKEEIYILTPKHLSKRTFPLNDIVKYLDSVLASNTNIQNMSVPDVLTKYTEWKRKSKDASGSGKQTGVKLIERLPNGYAWYSVTGRKALIDEGKMMQHCLQKDGYYNDVKAGRIQIFSLRDAQGEPHVTIEYRKTDNEIKQIKGKQNQVPNAKYIQTVLDFINQNNYGISDSCFDFSNLMSTKLSNGQYVLLRNYHEDLSIADGPISLNEKTLGRRVCDFPSIKAAYLYIRGLNVATKDIQCENLVLDDCKAGSSKITVKTNECTVEHSTIKELTLQDTQKLQIKSSNVKITAKSIDNVTVSCGVAGITTEFSPKIKIERLTVSDTPVEYNLIFGNNTSIDYISGSILPSVNLEFGSNSKIGELQDTACLSSLPDELQIMSDLTIDGKRLPKVIGVNVRVNGNLLVLHADTIPKDVMNRIKSIKCSKLILEK